MGCYIVEFEQNGEDRAAYGEQLLKKLEKRLNTKGLNERRFRDFRRLYLVYPQLKDEVLHYVMSGSKIRHTPSAEFIAPIRHTPSAKLQLTDRQNNALTLSPKKVFNKLPYSHLKSISQLDNLNVLFMNSKQLGDAGLLENWNVKSTHYIMSVADYPKTKKHFQH